MFDFHDHPVLDVADLPEVEELCPIFEGEHIDSDGVVSYIYTVGGILRGRPIVAVDHVSRSVRGALLGGDCIVVQASSRAEADAMAAEGLEDTRDMVASRPRRTLNAGILIESEIRKPRH